MHTAYLLIGGNLGNRIENLQKAAWLVAQEAGQVLRQSSLYETAAWGFGDQPDFLNQVLEIRTPLNAAALMSMLLKIEKQMGRVREERNGPRLIDIDILLYGDEIHHNDHISIPHPRLPLRRFALIPLAELIPSFIHPELQLTIDALLQQTPDDLPVKKYNG
ncbi:2-amino-4-hydroxy-6-hydroxymethyldihydropteridine diphosphokinase [Flavihumibacter petaseus]|uniref:2-amino-4-hydroxy-6-hydroxymethyldihydropteridine pyrophosphokinase n=1 Tax=Flavihumibacter petaseus NBRC 106054 TaxID=1220578 RepID=A0A0E9N1X8_9BACT|nr:2-amino-4-hydroxy-6-hydroxymethyldihydropteridine diphosphokinase [Flavihumibacter petaseus]GAO43636.1 2-amino-4-hydroxy-6-hydroxymethyldihydropteridine pyrophosphokinase [Flavihumibacter petaseus NBRC 106054]